MHSYYGLLLPIVTIVAVFTFVTVASWAENRRKERESYYREETYRKIVEHGGDSGDRILRLIRDEEAALARKRIEGMKLGGLITTVVGVGIMIFLRVLIGDEAVYLVGLIPTLVGVVLLIYSFFMAPRALARDRSETENRLQ
jgi:preprotein translocase subunit YajC